MEIQEVTLNIPLQYKAVQYCEGHFDELREWVGKGKSWNFTSDVHP